MRLSRFVVVCLLLSGTSPLAAQFEPAGTGGDPAIARDLGFLGQNRRVLVIGAHPDDEDSELLTILSRGMGAEAAYLSLNRGEGGQNLIGAELGEQLGLLRSEELLAARRVDGARQYFTRAYDFGFSKNLDDTWRHWPQDSVLKDVVRIVRRFRPQVIVSIFSGGPADGHGQHQAAGWAAGEAFLAAGDPARFPELEREEGLAPWAPAKLFRSTRFDTVGTTLVLDGGVLDPAVGQSYHQIAMRSRSLHRSQDMGQLQQAGPSTTRVGLVRSSVGAGNGLFDRIDTRIEALASAGPSAGALEQYAREARAGRTAFAAGDRRGALLHLAAADAELDAIRSGAGSRQSPELDDQARHLQRAVAALLGLVPDALASARSFMPGGTGSVVSRLWNAGADTVRLRSVLLRQGRESTAGAERVLLPGAVIEDTLPFAVADSAQFTTPYFMRQPREGDLYRWAGADPSVLGLPFEPPPFSVRQEIRWGGATMALEREAAYRYGDQALGEVRLPVTVAPRVSVRLDPPDRVWNITRAASLPITVTLNGTGADSIVGRVRLALPSGWTGGTARPFRLVSGGGHSAVRFTVSAPRSTPAGDYRIAAVAVDQSGREYRDGVLTVAYPHVRPRAEVLPAAARATRMSVILPPLKRVGYVRGAADRVPEALREAGVPLVMLDPATLAGRPLDLYDAIVIGPRAYETEPELLVANENLLDYARAGGLLIVQYQQYGYFLGGYPPYPMALASREPGQPNSAAVAGNRPRPAGLTTSLIGGHDRVTDETAPVRILDPTDPVVTRPNRLGPRDWEGWVQERGLYIPRQWDQRYQPVLETADPGESPLRGSLLVAAVGDGRYVYTGLSLFRQLPAGVPGAFRLFANLLALREATPATAGGPEAKGKPE